MEQQGRVVQTVVTTETTTDYEEEESMYDRIWRALDNAVTLFNLGIITLMAISCASASKKNERDNSITPKPNENE